MTMFSSRNRGTVLVASMIILVLDAFWAAVLLR